MITQKGEVGTDMSILETGDVEILEDDQKRWQLRPHALPKKHTHLHLYTHTLNHQPHPHTYTVWLECSLLGRILAKKSVSVS
jgi:hypothetical protein